MFKKLIDSPGFNISQAAMISEVNIYGLEGRPPYYNGFTMVDCRSVPGFPLNIDHYFMVSWIGGLNA